jgi:hypothetical protein
VAGSEAHDSSIEGGDTEGTRHSDQVRKQHNRPYSRQHRAQFDAVEWLTACVAYDADFRTLCKRIH